MMRNFTLFVTFAFLLAILACEKSVSETKPQNVAKSTPAAAPSIPKDGDYAGKGEVTKINLEIGSVELKHEDMPGLMPAMQMEFFVKDKAILKDIKVGDRVDFVVEYKHPQETIVSIKKAQ